MKNLKSVKETRANRIFFPWKRSSSDTPEDNSGSAAKPQGDAMYHTARRSAERFTNRREGHDVCHTVARTVKVTAAARSATFDRFS